MKFVQTGLVLVLSSYGAQSKESQVHSDSLLAIHSMYGQTDSSRPDAGTETQLPSHDASADELLKSEAFVSLVTKAQQRAVDTKDANVAELVPYMQKFKHFTPDLLEKIARDKKREIYYIAIAKTGKMKVNGFDGKPKQSYVHIVLSKKERDKILDKAKTKPAQNLTKLKNSGWVGLE